MKTSRVMGASDSLGRAVLRFLEVLSYLSSMLFRRWRAALSPYGIQCAGFLEDEEVAQAHRCQKVEMGAAATPVAESQDGKKLSNYAGPPVSLPKHSYWFDFWVFVIFDILFFLFIYFVVP